MQRKNFGSNAPWEPIVGYSRAVRVGSHVWVAGTTATGDDGRIVGGEDLAQQTRQALKNIEAALLRAGATLKDVVRTRTFLLDISRWEEAARVHGEFFRDIRPVATMVGVSGLVTKEMLVEIEAEAFITGESTGQ